MDNLVGQKKYMIKVRLYLPFVREEKQETYIDKDEFIATTPGLFMVFALWHLYSIVLQTMLLVFS